jgi:hypothetical protein
MAVKRGGESKQGLVVFLVFFILATLGLGVTTYYGFADQDRLQKEAKDAKAKEKTANDERNYYKAQAMILGAYHDSPPKDMDELAVQKTAFDAGQLGQSAKDKEQVKALFTKVQQTIKWDPAKNLPSMSYEGLLAEWAKRYEALENRNKALEKEKANEKARADNNQQALDDARKKFEADLATVTKNDSDKLATYVETIDNLRKEVARLGAKSEEDKNRALEIVKKAEDEKKKTDVKIRDQQTKIADLEERLALMEKRNADAPKDWNTDWKIVSIDQSGKMPFINLGSADNVNPQLTFRIHGVGPDGKPLPQGKGSLEVINVIGPHLSQARITETRDRARDPVLKGDVLFNPTFSPNQKKHVAIAGTVDFNGDGRDSVYEFIRRLEQQNVVVDAYLDPKDFSIKGPGITINTEYLIMGDLDPGPNLKDKDARAHREQGILELQKKAKDYSVPLIALPKYLQLIGYKLPRGGEEAPTNNWRPATPAVVTPPEKEKDKDMPKKDDKPPEKDKDMPKKDDKPPEDKGK